MAKDKKKDKKKKEHKDIENVGQLVDKLIKLPRKMKLWVGVPTGTGGFQPCLTVSHVSADKNGNIDVDDCGIILNRDNTYRGISPR
jgi:hypothetical protein